jgi:hypothetical protein
MEHKVTIETEIAVVEIHATTAKVKEHLKLTKKRNLMKRNQELKLTLKSNLTFLLNF